MTMFKILSHVNSINNEAESLQSSNPTGSDPVNKLVAFRGLIIVVLQFAKIFTNDTADKKINEIISWLHTL